MVELWGEGPKGMLAPSSKIIGGQAPLSPIPPLPTPMIKITITSTCMMSVAM